MTQHAPSGDDPLTGEVRFRVPLPILIPAAAIVVIGAVTVGLSRVLLSIPPEAATTVALAVSINVLIACALLASRPRMQQTSLVEMAIIVVYPVIIGIVIAQLGIGGGGHGGEAEGSGSSGAPVEGGAPVEAGGTIVTENFAFSSSEIVAPAEEDFEITLENEDAAPHNIYVYPDEGAVPDQAQALFAGDDVPGGDRATYSISGLDPGEYPFICQIHPNMKGTVTVE